MRVRWPACLGELFLRSLFYKIKTREPYIVTLRSPVASGGRMVFRISARTRQRLSHRQIASPQAEFESIATCVVKSLFIIEM
jgi:hypothetical protein